jgi:hypothetical protein
MSVALATPTCATTPRPRNPLGWEHGAGYRVDERDDEPSNVGVEVLEYPFMVWGFPRVITLSTLCNGQA